MFAAFVAILAVLDVMLAVFDAMLFVFVVILAVFDAILLVFVVILLVFVAMFAAFVAILAVLDVMLAVFDATEVGNVAIVDEDTPPTLFTVGAAAVPPKSFANCILPFVVASASGVTLFVILANTNSVVATWIVFVPTAAVGAVGVPVKEGEAIVALNAISAVLLRILATFIAISVVLIVILAVFEVTLVSSEVILAVFDAILLVLFVILSVLEAIDSVFAVMLAVLDTMFVVFEVTAAGSVEIVEELTPPILLTVVEKVPVPLPLTSPVKVINWSPEFTPPTVTSPITVNVVLELVPPAIVKPVANAVGVNPLIVLFVKFSAPTKVASVPVNGKVINVFPVATKVVLKLPEVAK